MLGPVVTTAASAALAFIVSSGEVAAAGQLRTQQRPTSLPAENGDVISSEPGVFYLNPLKAIKVDAGVHRITYRTTDRAGKVIAVTGTVLARARVGAGSSVADLGASLRIVPGAGAGGAAVTLSTASARPISTEPGERRCRGP
ncbi:hypothetical protein ACFVZH_36390 [Streptomyces sp. NPDC059534]|uniref:hypothetical protein n=1 Tax=Streptomyces sp. NPDC059534 TaxID=3346859 RepID=UPI003699D6B9